MATTAVRLRRDAELSRARAEELALALKALADPARMRIVDILKSQPNLEACVCDMTEPLGLSQPTVSHHLKVLTSAGILHRERRGSWAWYRLETARLGEIAAALRV